MDLIVKSELLFHFLITKYVFVKDIMKMVFTFALIKHLGRLLGKSQILEPFSIL